MIKLQLHPDPRILRQFAWASLVAFPVIGFLFHLRFGLPSEWMYAIAGVGLVVLATELMGLHALPRLVFRVLVLATFPIGLVLFPLLIGLIYYGLFTAIGLVFRLLGRDALHRRFDPTARSYWHERGKARSPASYFKLY